MCVGCHSLTWDSVSTRTRCSCSSLLSSRMRWFLQSATKTRPSLSNDKWRGNSTSVNVRNTRPLMSTSRTYTHVHKYCHLANWIKISCINTNSYCISILMSTAKQYQLDCRLTGGNTHNIIQCSPLISLLFHSSLRSLMTTPGYTKWCALVHWYIMNNNLNMRLD